MESLINLPELIRLIISLGKAALLVAGVLGGIYFASCLAIPSVFIVEYLPYVIIIGAFIGSGSQQILASINRNKTLLNNAQTKDQMLQNTIDVMWYNVDLGRLSNSEASEITAQAFRQRLLSNQETELPNISESQQQRQITPSQEEE
ncbi:MAG: hypothetical protein QNJ37_07025 [Crocosphaera sp.]|nr:hypothetical protein [Crocosphaera sp.]